MGDGKIYRQRETAKKKAKEKTKEKARDRDRKREAKGAHGFVVLCLLPSALKYTSAICHDVFWMNQ
jgi:hypothetical protein